jgi:pimeloyl-ACP methyl ester carboxylesterase
MHRRAMLKTAGFLSLALAGQARAQAPSASNRTYVLVHGIYGGGWIWRYVADGLRARGHKVFTPTQTGTGERAHLLSHQITIDTHIADIAGVFEAEDLSDVVLVGHSYGGMASTGVADRMPERIKHLVYLDALIPEDGDTAFGLLPAGMADARRKTVQEQGAGVAFPVPSPDAFPLDDGPVKTWFMSHLRPHPVGTYETPIRLKKPAGAGLPVTYVSYTDPALASIEPSRQRARAKQGWRLMQLPVIHDAEVKTPGRVIDLLASIE